MWLSVAPELETSTSSVFSESTGQGTERPGRGKPTDDILFGAGPDLHGDPGLDSARFKSSGCDVSTSDNDSGAVDDADLTGSDDVIGEPPAHIPDGGYGWVVVAASFFNAFIIDGVGSCYGLILPHVMEKYGSSASVASFAGSLFNALLIMGSVSVALVRKFGYQKVTISGGILACLAFVISAHSPNVVCFVLSYGLFTGCACGLVFLPSVVIVNSYFHEKRGLANGIISSGSGAGLLVLAQLVNYLLEEFSLEGSLLVLAGVLLNMCVFSSAYRPLGNSESVPPKRGNPKAVTSLKSKSGSTDSGLLSSESGSSSLETDSDDLESGNIGNAEKPVQTTDVDSVLEPCLACIEDSDTLLAKKDCSVDEDSHNYNVDEQEEMMPRAENYQRALNNEKETAVSADDSTHHNVSSHNGQTHDDCAKVSSTVTPSSKTEDPNAFFTDLHQKQATQRPPYRGRGVRQLWSSAYNIPTQPPQFHHRLRHSSAYDVFHLGPTSTRRGGAARGLFPLAERPLGLANPRYQLQSRSYNDHYQIKTEDGLQGESDQQSNVSYRHLHEHDFSRHHQFQTHHRRNHHHNSHSELDNGSNLYLTGSISTLRNLQIKHILHLATPQHAGLFSSPETPTAPKSFEANCHLLHASKSHISESSLHLPLPSHAKTDFFERQLSQQSGASAFPAEDESSSVCQISNKHIRSPILRLSSKQSLETSSGVPYHPIETSDMLDSSLAVSEWSLHLDGAQIVSPVDLEASPQDSLSVPATGYSLRQLLRMPCFYLFCIGSCLIQIGYPIPSIFLANLAYDQGLTTAHTTLIMGVMGGLNVAGRLLSGLLSNCGVNPLTLLYTTLFLGGVVCLLVPLFTTLWSLVLFAGLFGFLLGGFPPVQPLVIVEYFGLNSLASVFGLLTTIKGASSMLGPPLAGLVYDASGQYPMSFVFGGVVFILSAAVHMAMPFFRPRMN